MRKNFGKQSWMYPLPVLIIGTYNEDGSANAMNAAWEGFMIPTKYVSASAQATRPQPILKTRQAFTVSFADAAHVKEADYVGIVSGNKEPAKLEKAGLHTVRSEFVDAPLIEEFQ